MALLDHGGYPEQPQILQPPLIWTDGERGSHPDPDNDNRSGAPPYAPELDGLRTILPAALRAAAAERAARIGVSADRVLIHCRVLTDETYVGLLADALGIRLNPLSPAEDDLCLLPDDRLAMAAATGIVPIRRGSDLVYVVAPRHCGARGIAELAARRPDIADRIELTTTARLDRFLLRKGGVVLAMQAAHGLHDATPDLSAAQTTAPHGWRRALRALRIAGMAALIAVPPVLADGIWTALLAAFFLGFLALRFIGCAMPAPPQPRPQQADADLPVYTIVIALYREASSVAPLLHAIDALDYPREKLDVIVVTERDDTATQEALRRLGRMPYLRVLVAPDVGPRTKPKALNYALPFARGGLLAVFDAEDRPEPDQLRLAIATFGSDERLACAQATLCIDNGAESWIARLFAAEYAAQFDLFLPGLATLRLPLPLGGSSNHFRTDTLRAIGGWDAHNVTEDADLGIRLARFGHRATTFVSTTYEEAPVRTVAWLRQRTRWMKGWMHLKSSWKNLRLFIALEA